MEKQPPEDYVNWYSEQKSKYEELAGAVKQLIVKILEEKKIRVIAVEARAKEVDSFKEKLTRVRINPKEMQDLAGIRVVCKLDSDADRVYDIIKSTFKIDTKRTKDKATQLGSDKVGYQSIHAVATFSDGELESYKKFEGMYFEIQIRTALQHAWAEVSHDKSYKFSGKLPEKIERRLNLVAGALEILDNEFDRISDEIEAYKQEISTKTESGKLNEISIDSVSLAQFLTEKVGESSFIIAEFGSHSEGGKLQVEALGMMGIKTLADLNNVVPKDLKSVIERVGPKIDRPFNLSSIVSIILALYKPNDFFGTHRTFSVVSKPLQLILREYGLDLDSFAQRYELILM